jgi:TolB protein
MSVLPNKDQFGQFEGQTDVGSASLNGSCEYDSEQQTYTIRTTGAKIGADRDAFHFVWKRMTGNFIVTTRAAWSTAGADPHWKFGWMARPSLKTASPQVCSSIHADGLLSLQFRRRPGGPTEEIRTPLSNADVFQLERNGNTYIMSAARYGEPFTPVQASGFDLGEDLYVGLYVTSAEPAVIAQAEFQDVRIVVPVNPGFERGRHPFGSHLELLDLASGHRQIIYSSDDIFEAPNWTRDGQALIFNRNGRLVRFDLATEELSLIDTSRVVHNNNDHVISFDGETLAISSHTGPGNVSRLYTVPIHGGKPRLVSPQGPSYLHGWSPDGEFLVYTAQRGGQFDIYRIPVGGGLEEQLTDTPGLDDGPEYTPDGRYIYFNSVRSGSMQIWRMQPDGSYLQQMTDDEYNNWFPHISPDGRCFVFLSYLVGETEPGDHPPAKRVYLRLLPLSGGDPTVLAYLYGGQGTMNVPSWSPDGKRLAFVSNTVSNT